MKKINLILLLATLSSCTKEGKEGSSAFSLILMIFIAFAVVPYISMQFSKYKRIANKSNFFTFERFKTPITLIILFVTAFAFRLYFPTIFYPPPLGLKQIFTKKTDPNQINWMMDEMEKHPKNLNLPYNFLNETDQFPKTDFNYCVKAVLFEKINDPESALIEIDNIQTPNYPFTNFLKAKINFLEQPEYAKKLLFKELEQGIAVSPSLKLLFPLCTEEEKLELYQNPSFHQYLPIELIKEMTYQEKDWISGFILDLQLFYDTLPISSFVGAFFIFVIWILFFVSIDVFKKNSWGSIALVIGLSVLSTFTFIYFLNHYKNFRFFQVTSFKYLNQFIYYFIDVGLLEEITKLLPFLFVLFFTKYIKEPIDYILYAACSALTFAFLENITYFDRYSVELMSSRGMQLGLGHAMFSGIIAYALVLRQYKYKNWNFWLTLICGLGLAALSHALFNFLLFLKIRIVFLVYYLLLLHIWGIIINNCLNNSTFYNPKSVLKLGRLNFFLVVSLSAIVLLEFVIVGFKLGKDKAESGIFSSLLLCFYFIYFINVVMGRFDIIKGYWEKIQIPRNFGDILFPSKSSDSLIIGRDITLKSNKSNLELKKYVPIDGTIVERKIIRGNPEWYLVKLHWTLPIQSHINHHILIRFKHFDSDMDLDEYIPVEVALIKRTENFHLLEFLSKPRSLQIGFIIEKE